MDQLTLLMDAVWTMAAGMEGTRKIRSLAAGMDDHLSKPLEVRKLSEPLEKWLNPNRMYSE